MANKAGSGMGGQLVRALKNSKVVAYCAHTPLWFATPALTLALGIGLVVSSYQPLVFDASLYETDKANASELSNTVDAAALEAESAEDDDSSSSDSSSSVSSTSSDTWKDGTYTGTGYGYKSNITVQVTIKDHKITAIKVLKQSEDAAWFSKAKKVINYVLKAQSTNVDTVSGATYSSNGILKAISNALSKASSGKSSSSSSSSGSSTKKTTKKKSTAKATVDESATLADGTYVGYDRCREEDDGDVIFDYYLKVTITVKGGKVTNVVVDNKGYSTGNAGSTKLGAYDSVNDPYLKLAINGNSSYTGVLSQVKSRIAAGKSVAGIDVVSGATYSCNSIVNAYYDALKKAAAAAGKTVEQPADSSGSAGSDTSGDSGSTSGGSSSGSTGDQGTSGSGDSGDSSSDVDPEKSIFGTFPDGSYTGYALCQDTKNKGAYSPYYLGVTVAAKDGAITEVTSVFGDADGTVDSSYRYDAAENKYYLERARDGYGISGKHPGVMKQLNTYLSAGTEVGSIDTISGARIRPFPLKRLSTTR